LADSVTSRELGLLLAHQLLAVEDLHYGLWDAGLPVTLANLGTAQQRYTELLLAVIEQQANGITAARILDVGCGTGHMLERLLAQGYRADAVNPSASLNRVVRERLHKAGRDHARLLETTFENLPAERLPRRYDLVLFSESFQYVPMPACFAQLAKVLTPAGRVVICDFFRTPAHGQGGTGDRSFGGGHDLAEFYRLVRDTGFCLERDTDLTARVSPTIELLDTLLRERLIPATGTLASWIQGRYPFSARLLQWLLRHRLARLRYKYLSGNRSRTVFETYKTYRLLVLRAGTPAGDNRDF